MLECITLCRSYKEMLCLLYKRLDIMVAIIFVS